MKHPRFRKELLVSIFISSLYLCLHIFRYHLDRYGPSIAIAPVIKVVYMILFVLLAFNIFKIIKRRKKSKGAIKLRFIFYLPAIITLMALSYKYSPVRFSSEKLASKTVLSGCYGGNIGELYIRFRTNKHFDIRWTYGRNMSSVWYYGTYEKDKDTLQLTYEEETPKMIGARIFNNGQNLISIDTAGRFGNDYIIFLVGDCEAYQR